MFIIVSIVKRRGFLVSEMSRDKCASDFVDDAQLVKFVLVRLLVDGRSCGSDGGIGFCLRGHLSLQIQRKQLKFYVYPLNGELTTTNVSKTSFTSLNVNGAFVRSASVKIGAARSHRAAPDSQSTGSTLGGNGQSKFQERQTG